jgi:hypothetical protein
MGEKKKKEEEVARWKKVVVIAACLLFVVLMVVSGMGYGWLSMFAVTKPGETVVIDYTLYDGSGNAVITTDQQVYTKAASEGKSILGGKQIAVVANQNLTTMVYPVPVYTAGSGWDNEFALFATEHDAISSAVVGMGSGQQKTVTLPTSSTMSQLWSAEQLALSGIDIETVTVGDTFAMGVSDSPDTTAENQSAKSYLRIAEITRKTPAGIVVEFGYPRAEIRVVSIHGSR